MEAKRAIVLLSGGLDSCASAAIAKHQEYSLYALTIDYGQKHNREIESARSIAHKLSVEKHVIFPLSLDIFGHSSLVDSSLQIPKPASTKDIGSSIPSTYVPARNTIFLSLALAYAEVHDADAIFIGVNAVDYSGYPDCRPAFIEAFQNMATYATKRAVEGNPPSIQTPLLHLSKKQIIQKGVEVHAPFELSWSCYQGGSQACGQCDSCLLRLQGFQDAGIDDPLKYSTYPMWYAQKN